MRPKLLKIKKYMKIYDPGYFNFIYSLKAMIAIILSVIVNFLIFEAPSIVWSTLIPMNMFFVNAIVTRNEEKRFYLFLTLISLLLGITFFSFLANIASIHETLSVIYIFPSIIVLSFIVAISKAYHEDMHRTLNLVMINCLVAYIYSSYNFKLTPFDYMLIAFNGGMISIIIGIFIFDNSSSYGKYTRVYFPIVINYMISMLKNINNRHEYYRYKGLSLLVIGKIKGTLHNRSNYVKDSYMIKNIQRAIFYIYKIEEIYLSINLMYEQIENMKNFKSLQYEILHNLNELNRIFEGHVPNLKNVEYKKVLASKNIDKRMLNLIILFYNKIETFSKADKNPNEVIVSENKDNLRDILKSIKIKDDNFKFSIKYCIAISASILVSFLFNINNGIWITIGIASILRPSLGGIQLAGKQHIAGAILGILFGTSIVFLTSNIVFYLILCFVIFLIVYTRVYPYWVWSTTTLCGFVMMYSALYDNFLYTVFDRLIDIFLGIIFSIIIFWSIWPKYSRDEVSNLIKLELNDLTISIDLLMRYLSNRNALDYAEFQKKQDKLLVRIEDLRTKLKACKNEKARDRNLLSSYGNDLILILNSMVLRVIELSDHCFEFSKDENVELYLIDLNVIKTRFEMIEKFLKKSPHYFQIENNHRFLNKDTQYFSWIIKDIFEFQNRFYKIAIKKE